MSDILFKFDRIPGNPTPEIGGSRKELRLVLTTDLRINVYRKGNASARGSAAVEWEKWSMDLNPIRFVTAIEEADAAGDVNIAGYQVARCCLNGFVKEVRKVLAE